ncbi:MAG: OmpA family protein [Endomicrobia bacterium]|nr:OmpA family protein [Endomicrobiia bacterium]
MKKNILFLLLLCCLTASSFAQQVRYDPEPVTLNISLENTLFSPAAKADEGVVFNPEVKNFKKTKLWFLTIRNSENNKKVREIISKKTDVPEKVVWDGLASDGKVVPDGMYYYKFFVLTDKGSRVIEKNKAITIDSTPPFVSFQCSHDVYFTNPEDNGKFTKNLTIYLSAGDENGIDYSKSYVEILSYNDKRVKEFAFNDKIPEFIMWDGIDEVYDMPLPVGNYKINFTVADNAGNISQIDSEISVAPLPKDPEPPKEEVEVKQEERGLVINLSSKVLFDVAKSDLKSEAEKALNEVAAILRVYSKNKVLIEGHTDSSGNKQKNMQLSLDRAQSVFDFFANTGIDKERMQVFGFGSDRPVADNATEKGKEQNRRVEIVILKEEEPEPAVQIEDKSN